MIKKRKRFAFQLVFSHTAQMLQRVVSKMVAMKPVFFEKTAWIQSKLKTLPLNDRERHMLWAGVFCSVLYAGYAGLYAPLRQAVSEQTMRLQEAKQTLQLLQQRPSLEQSVRVTLTRPQLLTTLTTQLNTAPFHEFAYQLQQTGSEDVQLTFTAVPYGLFMTWLWSFTEHYKVSLTQLDVAKTKTSGVVSLTLLMR